MLDLDIRGFLIDPEQFMEGRKQDGKTWGFVYVLNAPSHAVQGHPLALTFKSIVKVGETRRMPEKRADELSAGLLHERYTVFGAVYTNARLRLEEMIKAELHHCLVAKEEFFDIHPKKALKKIRKLTDKAEVIGDPKGDKRNSALS